MYARIATILALIEETPDAAIEELRQALTKKGVTFGYGTIRRLFARPWAAIGRMVDLFTPAGFPQITSLPQDTMPTCSAVALMVTMGSSSA